MQLTNDQFALIKQQFATLKERSAFYAAKFDGIDLSDVQTQEDFEKLPFSEKDDLRNAYPLGLQAVPDEEVVRIHSSSGTTGTPVIVPYTQQDVTDWAVQFARCYETAGITNRDRIHITPGYGLWTAGIGFQLGAERLGAMTIPMGPGNTEKQLRMMQDLTGVDPHEIPLDDPDTMSIFISSKVLGYENDPILGPTGAVAIPEFNTRFTRQMLIDTQPKDFNTLVRLSGFSHGTDVWMGNARELILSGTASVLETVGCRDDIMLYLISKGLDPKMSFKIMEKVRKGKVKKGGFDEGWEEAMMEHDVPDWYIESLAKIGYLFPKAHAVAYVMMAFRIAWFKVHEPLAFYATFFSVRAKAFDAEYCCAGMDAVKRKIKEIENNKDATAVEQNLLTTLEVCYEFYLRGFHFDTINIYKSDATKFIVTEKGLLPPFVTVHGLGEAAALDTVEKRKGKEFISIEEFAMCCNKLSKTHIEQLKALGAFAGMADTSQITLF